MGKFLGWANFFASLIFLVLSIGSFMGGFWYVGGLELLVALSCANDVLRVSAKELEAKVEEAKE